MWCCTTAEHASEERRRIWAAGRGHCKIRTGGKLCVYMIRYPSPDIPTAALALIPHVGRSVVHDRREGKA